MISSTALLGMCRDGKGVCFRLLGWDQSLTVDFSDKGYSSGAIESALLNIAGDISVGRTGVLCVEGMVRHHNTGGGVG